MVVEMVVNKGELFRRKVVRMVIKEENMEEKVREKSRSEDGYLMDVKNNIIISLQKIQSCFQRDQPKIRSDWPAELLLVLEIKKRQIGEGHLNRSLEKARSSNSNFQKEKLGRKMAWFRNKRKKMGKLTKIKS